MKGPGGWSYLAVGSALAVTVAMSGCSTLLRTGLGAAGVDVDRETVDRAARDGSGRVATLEVVPNRLLSEPGAGRFIPVSTGLGRWASRDPCAPTPQGIARVLPVVDGAPVRSLGWVGPLELYGAGLPYLVVDDLLNPDGPRFRAGLEDRTGRLLDRGFPCGFKAFLGVRLSLLGPADPVSVYRRVEAKGRAEALRAPPSPRPSPYCRITWGLNPIDHPWVITMLPVFVSRCPPASSVTM